jgi:hypothetical protein
VGRSASHVTGSTALNLLWLLYCVAHDTPSSHRALGANCQWVLGYALLFASRHAGGTARRRGREPGISERASTLPGLLTLTTVGLIRLPREKTGWQAGNAWSCPKESPGGWFAPVEVKRGRGDE